MQYDPRIYKVGERDSEKTCNSTFEYDEVKEKRYAEYLRRQTGWDVPVYVNSLGQGKVDQVVAVDVKRKQQEEPGDGATKESEVEGGSGNSSKPEQVKTIKNAGKKPGWVLGREIEWEVDFS